MHGYSQANMHDKHPRCPCILLLVQVVRAGGISPVLQPNGGASADAHPADGHAVGDALDCVEQVVTASEEGRSVALQSGGVSAAAQALQVSLPLLQLPRQRE